MGFKQCKKSIINDQKNNPSLTCQKVPFNGFAFVRIDMSAHNWENK